MFCLFKRGHNLITVVNYESLHHRHAVHMKSINTLSFSIGDEVGTRLILLYIYIYIWTCRGIIVYREKARSRLAACGHHWSLIWSSWPFMVATDEWLNLNTGNLYTAFIYMNYILCRTYEKYHAYVSIMQGKLRNTVLVLYI